MLALVLYVPCASMEAIDGATSAEDPLVDDVEPSPGQAPIGPNTLTGLFDWPRQFLERLVDDPVGSHFVNQLKRNHGCGIQVNTDYSGFGGPEIALQAIAGAVQEQHTGVNWPVPRLLFWRASDILPRRRRMLLAASADARPLHVFGDLMSRIRRSTRYRLRSAMESAEAEFKLAIDQGNTGTDLEAIALGIGEMVMKKLFDILRDTFHRDRTSYCYRCKGLCRIHGPTPGEADNKCNMRIAVAGTTCTSWSAMGTQGRWLAASAVPFAVWAMETLFWSPHIIFHECTPRFDVATLMAAFGTAYLVISLVFSPTHLGWPASRSRRFTIMLHRQLVVLPHMLSQALFSSFFFRRCGANGNIFFCAPQADVAENLGKMAGELHMERDGNWTPREVLKQGALQRLLGYERMCRRIHGGRRLSFLVNLRQNASFTRSLAKYVPTLMTSTSLIWSMRHGRTLSPEEHLVVMGLAVYSQDLFYVSRGLAVPGILVRLNNHRLSKADILHASGNGMVQIAIGAILMFGIGGVVVVSHVSESNASDSDLEDPEI